MNSVTGEYVKVEIFVNCATEDPSTSLLKLKKLLGWEVKLLPKTQHSPVALFLTLQDNHDLDELESTQTFVNCVESCHTHTHRQNVGEHALTGICPFLFPVSCCL